MVSHLVEIYVQNMRYLENQLILKNSCIVPVLRICVRNIESWKDFNKKLSILCFVKRIWENYTVFTTLYWRIQIRSQLKSLQSVFKYLFSIFFLSLLPLVLRKLCIFKVNCLGLLNSSLALWSSSLDAFNVSFRKVLSWISLIIV